MPSLALWLASAVVALCLGSLPLEQWGLIEQVRLPRVILASSVGIGLSVAGAALQSLFANPLCDPYTLGISSGAAFGCVLGAVLGLPLGFSGVVGSAFVGAMSFALILVLISLRTELKSSTLLLCGVMLGFLGTSLVTLGVVYAEAAGFSGGNGFSSGFSSLMGWIFGDLSRARLWESMGCFIGVLLFSVLIGVKGPDLDRLLLGEEQAATLGVSVGRLRTQIILLSSVLVALCVSSAGVIGFIGLVIPHLARRKVGSLHQRLLPLCGVWGAIALTASDTLARIVIKPYELPVGVVTTLLGVPFFFWILLQRGSKA